MIETERPSYDELVARHGAPVGVEEARDHWGSLVRAAGSGETTLITRERWEWAALVPLSAVAGVLSGLPVVSLSTARSKLGDLVRQAAEPYDDTPVLLTRHRTPVAALVGARRLLERPAPRRRTDADGLLSAGHTITLVRNAGERIVATAHDPGGNEVAAGWGRDAAEALRSLSAE
ncbi:type II toxin-antitoxin system prevent-host-death family antitoxin [Nonomuraea sp. K274]|uniref:Type II toxin-antitoxin system prevent-host-death family antitoxin n=1 Tax=Nonomuraea cypriaca TaxID=1187855 RepID=A0A931AL09_9ACTN|nr:type II toxin-antitoxin system prevent-host-death family antitoxin [Nonomuraea cypriaca]MBF8193710.1 type II toxin-antitoxin system prevent-host-death family antitoxin [Nonomuraea cypriaca]